MKRLVLILLVSIICFDAVSQNPDIPIITEKPKRGIYQTFEEFKFNVPGIADSFYVETEVRTQENWEGTYSLIPRYASNNRKVKKVWGFSDGVRAYTFHQFEFFEVEVDSGRIGFHAYQELDNTGAAVAGVVGGAIGGGIYSAVAIKNAKKKKIFYEINPINGRLNDANPGLDDAGLKPQSTKVIFYRKGKKEMEEGLNISINDSIDFVLMPNSVKELDVPVSGQPLKVCYGEQLDKCIDVIIISDEDKYVEGSISSKTHEALIEQVAIEVGEFYSKKSRYLQEKREKEGRK